MRKLNKFLYILPLLPLVTGCGKISFKKYEFKTSISDFNNQLEDFFDKNEVLKSIYASKQSEMCDLEVSYNYNKIETYTYKKFETKTTNEIKSTYSYDIDNDVSIYLCNAKYSTVDPANNKNATTNINSNFLYEKIYGQNVFVYPKKQTYVEDIYKTTSNESLSYAAYSFISNVYFETGSIIEKYETLLEKTEFVTTYLDVTKNMKLFTIVLEQEQKLTETDKTTGKVIWQLEEKENEIIVRLDDEIKAKTEKMDYFTKTEGEVIIKKTKVSNKPVDIDKFDKLDAKIGG